jgi:hypothetical protein
LLSQGAYAMKILERSDMTGCLLEAKQANHATAGGCYSKSKHHQEFKIFGEYSS